jgi:hypothetical protein
MFIYKGLLLHVCSTMLLLCALQQATDIHKGLLLDHRET